MQNKTVRGGIAWLALFIGLWASCPLEGLAAREVKGKTDAPAGEEMEAKRLLERGQELLKMQEPERGVAMLESILEQYPASDAALESSLSLGRHYLGAREQLKAISYFNRLKLLEQEAEKLTTARKEMYLEAMYSIGVAYFQTRQFAAAFPILRKITTNYPNTLWANQAYYYIGMCHFAQQNWNKAIDALNLVGTFIDPTSPAIQFAEAGRRFYLKIQDADLPVLAVLGRHVTATLETKYGDKESVECMPLSAGSDIFIGSLPTEIGPPKAGDQSLQVAGGDAVTVRYVDSNTQSGDANRTREKTVKIVSSADLSFTLGDYETKAAALFLDQPAFVLLQDLDLDASARADTAQVKLISRHKQEEDAETADGSDKVNVSKLLTEQEQKYVIRDQVQVTLTERGPDPVRTGRFGGLITLESAKAEQAPNPSDQILTCDLGDEVVVTYTDEVNIQGDSPVVIEASMLVSGEIDNRPKASQDIVSDAVVRAKKHLVEGTAYLELARIFKSMGLTKGAKQKAVDGLERVDAVVRATAPIPSPVRQEAFRVKWDLHIVSDDFANAMATCTLFNQLYPDSPFVDQALLGIARIRMENKEYSEAMSVFQRILALPKSEAKAEAQFGIAQGAEALRGTGSESAIREYRLCAERYPDSEYAGQSLAKVVDYQVDKQDYAQAQVLLEQIFQDYPDAPFLDSMLLKWVLVAYRSGDYQKAYEKCSQLIFEYPSSTYAEKAKQLMPRIEARTRKGSAAPAESGAGG